jgi:hypothetical protein
MPPIAARFSTHPLSSTHYCVIHSTHPNPCSASHPCPSPGCFAGVRYLTPPYIDVRIVQAPPLTCLKCRSLPTSLQPLCGCLNPLLTACIPCPLPVLQEYDVRIVQAPPDQQDARKWMHNLQLGLVSKLNQHAQVVSAGREAGKGRREGGCSITA